MGKFNEFMENPYNRDKIKRILAIIVLLGMLFSVIFGILSEITVRGL